MYIVQPLFFPNRALFQQIILGVNTVLGLQDTPFHKIVDPVITRFMKMFFCCSVLSQKPKR